MEATYCLWLSTNENSILANGEGGIMPGPGEWGVICKSDPRWNTTQRNNFIDGLWGCQEMYDYIKEKEKELGTPPADCRIWCMKD